MFVHPATHHFSRTYTSQNAGHPTTSRKNLNKENAGALPSKTPSRMTAKGLVPSTSIRVGLGVKSTIKDGNVQNGGGGGGKGKGKDEDIGKPCHACPMQHLTRSTEEAVHLARVLVQVDLASLKVPLLPTSYQLATHSHARCSTPGTRQPAHTRPSVIRAAYTTAFRLSHAPSIPPEPYSLESRSNRVQDPRQVSEMGGRS